MKISHVVSSLDPMIGGPAYSVPSLVRGLRQIGDEVCLRSLEDGAGIEESDDVSLHPLSKLPFARSFSFSRSLQAAVERDLQNFDIVHSHGMWLAANVLPGLAHKSKKHRSRLVVSPRGMLAPAALNYSRWKKTALWHLAQRRALLAADMIHATSAEECRDVRALGVTAPIVIIPNGVDVPERYEHDAERFRFTLLYIGRVHPKKGLDRLIDAWTMICADFPDWQLEIVGPSEDRHAEWLNERAMKAGAVRYSIAPAAFGTDKDRIYREADLFVLPTRSENFGLVVAEALSHELPVVCTDGAPWERLPVEGCGWWIPQDVETLAATLREAMKLPYSVRREMGERGRRWMIRDFSWGSIAEDMQQAYRWLKSEVDRPAQIDLMRSSPG